MLVFRLLSRHSLRPTTPSWRVTIARHALLAFFAGCSATIAHAASASAPLKLTFGELAASPLIVPAPEAGRDAWLQQLSAPVRAAEGNAVEITGYVLPLKIEGRRTRQFLLMRDQSSCCFGKPPAVNEYVVVSTAASSPGIPATMDLPTTIRATLRIDPVSFGGELSQFYTLQNASVATP